MPETSLRRNVVFNYAGQLYTTLIGIVILPLYLRYMGAETFGLVGFFTLVQSWIQILDMGMSPTLSREIARLKNYPQEHGRLVTVVNSLETLFVVLALIIGASLYLSRGLVASDWLNFTTLSVSTVSSAVGIISIIAAMRWFSSINRSGINAYEAQVWMNIVEIIINTLRFPVALGVVIWAKGDVEVFFYYQFAVVVLEVLLVRAKLRSLLPLHPAGARRFSFRELRRIAPFALSIGFTGGIWVLYTQLDKLLLSKVLPLEKYGYFTLVAMIASGVMLLSGPVSKAILPRMTALLEDGQETAMLRLYRRSTRIVVSLTAPVTLLIAVFPHTVIYVWTGDTKAADWTAQVLPLFVIGSGLMGIIAFQYYLQYAHGYLRYHVIYNTAMVIATVPLITWAAFRYGPIGVGWVWLSFRLFALFFWLPFIHRKFARGIHVSWLGRDVLPGVLVAGAVVGIVNYLHLLTENGPRTEELAILATTGLVAVGASLAVSMRSLLWNKLVHLLPH